MGQEIQFLIIWHILLHSLSFMVKIEWNKKTILFYNVSLYFDKNFLENLNVGSNESSVEMKQMLNIYLSINKCIFLCNISYYFGLCSGVAIKMLENIAFKMDLFSFQNAPNLAFLYFQRVRNFNFKVQETKYLSLLV